MAEGWQAVRLQFASLAMAVGPVDLPFAWPTVEPAVAEALVRVGLPDGTWSPPFGRPDSRSRTPS